MHVADITMFYAKESGGVRRYLTAKRLWLQHHAHYCHSLLVPGARDTPAVPGDIINLRSPRIACTNGYRLPLRPGRWHATLRALQPDLIEVGDPYHLAWVALDAGQRLGIPVVGFYHSDLPRLVHMRFGCSAGRLAARYVRSLYRHFDCVLAPSAVMVQQLQSMDIAQAVQQPLGVDTRCFAPQRRDPWLRRQLGLTPETRLLVYVGRFAREKNLPLLFAAMCRLGRPYHLLLVGSGVDLPAQRNVTCWPYQSDAAALARVIASCDALVHPGHQETFGLIVLEAMACGVPVVGVAAGGVAELVDPSVGVLAKPNDADALAAAITALYAADRGKLGHQARGRAERYSWNVVLGDLSARYAALLGRPGLLPTPSLPLVHGVD